MQVMVDAESDDKVPGEQEVKLETKGNGGQSTESKVSSEKELIALNLRTLQGAFYLVMIGHVLAVVTLIFEIEKQKPKRSFSWQIKLKIWSLLKRFLSCFKFFRESY